MSVKRFRYSSEVPASAKEVFDWHLRRGALERLLPPWKKVELLFPPGLPNKEGSRVGLRLFAGLFSFPWILENTHCIPNREFTDVQIRGPFRAYSQCHRFISSGASSCTLVDEIAYSSPCSLLDSRIESELLRYFSWRHSVLREEMGDLTRYAVKKMRILVTGGSGLVGSALILYLRLLGHEVFSLVREREKEGDFSIYWDLESPHFPEEKLEGFDALIHLGGVNIAEKRWSAAYKEKIWVSRCRGTWLLAQGLSRLKNPPRCAISASAIGYYGTRGEEELTEGSLKGKGFLADLCGQWESSLEPLKHRGTRVVNARLGAVLSSKGGMLAKMLPAFQLGLGGRLGSGKQWISWIGIDDVLSALNHILHTEGLEGAVNLTAPEAVMQRDFARIFAQKLGRPALFPVPEWILKVALGEMADEMLLSSAKVTPEKLIKSGFAFRYPDLATALRFVM